VSTDPDIQAACIGYDATTGRPCTRTAARTIRAGCVHEHASDRPLCLAHTTDLAEGRMVCGNCTDHTCTLVPADPATAVVSRRDLVTELTAQFDLPDDVLDELIGDET
jgi:hypothetical protein